MVLLVVKLTVAGRSLNRFFKTIKPQDLVMGRILTFVVFIVMIQSGLTACVVTPSAGQAEIIITDNPPPPRYIIPPPPPSSLHIWIQGYWQWTNNRYVWVPGHYARPPKPGAHWRPGQWVKRRGGWVWIPGYWDTPGFRPPPHRPKPY